MGGAESALLDPVPVERGVVLAAVSLGRRSGSTNIRIERAACSWVRIGSPTVRSTEPLRVLDRPCARRQFRCAGRDEETAAQPNKETGLRDQRSTPHSMQAVRFQSGG